MDIYIPRPRGLVPGSREWLMEVEGPKIIRRLVDEVHAGEVGGMTPTQARCASILIDRILPTMSAVTHTIEGSLAQMTEAEIVAELSRITTPLTLNHKTDPSDTKDTKVANRKVTQDKAG